MNRALIAGARIVFAGAPASAPAGAPTPPAADDAGPITFDALALPYGVEVPASPWGDVIVFAPGSIATPAEPERVKLLLDHRTKPFGYATGFADDDAAVHASFAVPRDELADPEVAAAIRQMRNGVRDAVSVGVNLVDFDVEPINPDDRSWMAPDRYTVRSAELLEVSSVVIPRFADARHPRLAASHPGAPMRTATLAATGLAAGSPVDPDPDPDDPDAADETSRRRAHLAALEPARVVVVAEPSPLARFASLGDYTRARWTSPDTTPDLAAALVDQVLTVNVGVNPPAWVQEVKGIVDLGRPFVAALGGAQAETESLDVNWPYFDGDLKTLVGVQATEKTDITSVVVTLKRGTGHLDTYAGGSDISVQLIEKSSPSYLDAYMRIMFAAFAAVTDNAAVDQAYAAAGQEAVVDLLTADAQAIATAIFSASVMVQTATGSPASVVACASDIFPTVAGTIASLLAPSANTAGASMNAATLEVRLAGLTITHDPYLGAGEALVTNRAAYAWAEDGPRTISADNVAQLGRDVAVYGYGRGIPYTANGIVKLVPVASPPLARAETSSSSRAK